MYDHPTPAAEFDYEWPTCTACRRELWNAALTHGGLQASLSRPSAPLPTPPPAGGSHAALRPVIDDLAANTGRRSRVPVE